MFRSSPYELKKTTRMPIKQPFLINSDVGMETLHSMWKNHIVIAYYSGRAMIYRKVVSSLHEIQDLNPG